MNSALKIIAYFSKKQKFFAYFVLFFIFVLSSCTNEKASHQTYQGYIEGRFTYVSPDIAGVLVHLFVKRGDTVKKGDPLFLLEPLPESEDVKQTEANLEQAKAQRIRTLSEIEDAELTFERQSKLLLAHATPQSVYDTARIDLDKSKAELASEEANIKSLEAALAKAKWAYGEKTVAADKPAFVYDIFHLIGEYVPISRPVMSLITSEDIRIVFFVPQAELSNIQIGGTVSVHCDDCAKEILGTIDFISPKAEYTPPVIYSEKERSKLIFRIEATPSLADINRLHPGQPVDVHVNTKSNKTKQVRQL